MGQQGAQEKQKAFLGGNVQCYAGYARRWDRGGYHVVMVINELMVIDSVVDFW